MKVFKYNTIEFYDTMCEWCKGHNFPEVSLSLMPKNIFVCHSDKGEPIYSICFYYTDSRLCWIGWPVSNPSANKEDKKGGLEFLINKVNKFAKDEGFKVVFTTSNTRAVESALLNSGYGVGDTEVKHYLKEL